MRVLIIGLGSMGKRRVRCLRALGIEAKDICGYDIRPDRRAEAESLYGITTGISFDDAFARHRPDALNISTPPDQHYPYMKEAVERGVSFFVEASVLDDGIEDIIRRRDAAGISAVPSNTTIFHPAATIIHELIRAGRLGRLSGIYLNWGQYLPGWHTYESVADFYVSNPKVGGAREIVPWQFSLFAHILGFPSRVCGFFKKTTDIPGAEKVFDTYNCLMDYDSFTLNISVDVVARPSVNRIMAIGDKGQLRWDWDRNEIDFHDAAKGVREKIPYAIVKTVKGYNENISEDMYIRETEAFLREIGGGEPFPGSLEKDLKVLKTLYALEQSDRENRIVPIPFAEKASYL